MGDSLAPCSMLPGTNCRLSGTKGLWGQDLPLDLNRTRIRAWFLAWKRATCIGTMSANWSRSCVPRYCKFTRFTGQASDYAIRLTGGDSRESPWKR